MAMTHPEQQAVEAYMEKLNFVKEEHSPEGYAVYTNGVLRITDRQATFFYRTFQAQVAEARQEGLNLALGLRPSLMHETHQRPGMCNYCLWEERIEAQLNPQKPKGDK